MSTRIDTTRNEVFRLVRQQPFQPFMLSLENGDRITIDHPENIAFIPDDNGTPGSTDFYVLARGVRFSSTFEAVTAVATEDAASTLE